jgi:hypothetical protein
MVDVKHLRGEVDWWTKELQMRQERVREAVEKLRVNHEELMRAEQEEARNKSHQ